MELWDICDKYGNVTGRTREKGQPFEEGEYHVAVEAWILNEKGEFLIQKRSSKCQHYPGVWSLTAGRIQAGETPAEGCAREIEEEIGLRIPVEELHHLEHLNREDGSHMIWDVFVTKRKIAPEEFCLDDREVDEVKWITGDEFQSMIEEETIFLYPEIGEFLERIRKLYE